MSNILAAGGVCKLLNIPLATLQKLTGHCLFPKPSFCDSAWKTEDIEIFQRLTHDTDLVWLAEQMQPEPVPLIPNLNRLTAADLRHDDSIDDPADWLSADGPDNAQLDEADSWLQANRIRN